MSNEAILGEEATFNLCAKCGSKKFSQKRIWFESKADFEDQ
jgi:predicted nucleic-acid-binding Zn-ribbon protein